MCGALSPVSPSTCCPHYFAVAFGRNGSSSRSKRHDNQESKMLTSASIEMKPNRQSGGAEPVSTFRPEVTYLTSFLPYPIDQGGIMATAGFIEALAKCTSVSVLVLTSASYPSDQIRAAENYYNQFCR